MTKAICQVEQSESAQLVHFRLDLWVLNYMLLFNLFPSLTEYSKINVKCTHSVLQNQCKKITKEKTRTYDFIVITNIYITDTIVHILKKKYNSDHSNSLKKKLKIFNIKELRTKTTHKINTNDFKTLKILLHKNESIDLIYPLISVSNESGHITRTVVFFLVLTMKYYRIFSALFATKV